MNEIGEWANQIHQGDTRDVLDELPESSVHMAMCSPPYFGLRDYGVDGQIGLEESLDEYVNELVGVGRKLRRVLRDDGSWWLNLGDSFAGSWGGQSHDSDENPQAEHHPEKNPDRNTNLKRKNKMLVPHRVAIALQSDGWVVRSDCVWAKPNPMPDPVKDRLNETKEFVFHLTPNPDYWFDLDAIREPYAESTVRDFEGEYAWSDGKYAGDESPHSHGGINDPDRTRDEFAHPDGKNPGDVFDVTVKPFPDAHFAVYPPELCKKPIKSSCPPKVCAECGTPYDRDVDRTVLTDEEIKEEYGHRNHNGADERNDSLRSNVAGWELNEWKLNNPDEFKGWEQSCDCSTEETRPGIVLDPFAGAGTTCLVAKQNYRRFVGVELNPEYVAIAQERTGVDVNNPEYIHGHPEQGTVHDFP